MFTFKNLSLNAVKSLFTFNLTGKQLVKTVELLLKFQIALDFHPSKRTILKIYSVYYSETENNVLQSSNRSTSLSYQRDCILTFRTFCQSLKNLAVLTKINYLVGMETETHASQFFPFSWFFKSFWLSFTSIIVLILQLLILHIHPGKSFQFLQFHFNLTFDAQKC